MQKPDSRETDNNFSLEELLALKKQERPDDAYWQRFERELHAKPWQKMVARQSWMRRFWVRLQDNVHPAIPVGSTAALALAGYWTITLTPTTAEHQPYAPAPTMVAAVEAPAPVVEAAAPEAAPDVQSADPHFVVGAFDTADSNDPAFTRIAATHYMPASQSEDVHFAFNTIDSAAHATLAMATGPTRTIY